MGRGLFLAEIVVLYLYAEDYHAADGGDQVGDEKEYPLATEHVALNHETDAADGHHEKRSQGDVVGAASTYCLNGLGQVAQDQADACRPADDLIESVCLHCHYCFFSGFCEDTHFL